MGKVDGVIIILGAPNDENGRLSKIALERCQQALVECYKHPHYRILPTGGWGAHFNTSAQPHGHYVQQKLIQQGIPDSAFLSCVKSSNTIEDAFLSRPILDAYPQAELIIVTSDFHAARARFLFKCEFPERTITLSTAKTDVSVDELAHLQAHEKQALLRLENQNNQNDMQATHLNQISKHVYWLAPDGTTDRPTLGVVAGENSTLIVDAGNSSAHANMLLDGMAKRGIAAPNYVLLTHAHWDHVFGAAAFDAPLFASQETQRIVAEMVDLDWSDAALDDRVAAGTEIEFCREMIKVELPERSDLKLRVPEIAFEMQIEFDLGGLKCEAKHVGGDHASDSTIVYVPADKILFLSDCLYEDLHHGPVNYTIPKLYPLIDEIMQYEADFYIFGHHQEPMPKSEMVAYTDLLKAIGSLVARIGDDRKMILDTLQKDSDGPLDEDHVEIVDSFLAGLQR